MPSYFIEPLPASRKGFSLCYLGLPFRSLIESRNRRLTQAAYNPTFTPFPFFSSAYYCTVWYPRCPDVFRAYGGKVVLLKLGLKDHLDRFHSELFIIVT